MTVDVQMTDAGVVQHLEGGIPFSEKYRPQSLSDVASHKAGDEATGPSYRQQRRRSHSLLPRFDRFAGHY